MDIETREIVSKCGQFKSQITICNDFNNRAEKVMNDLCSDAECWPASEYNRNGFKSRSTALRVCTNAARKHWKELDTTPIRYLVYMQGDEWYAYVQYTC